MRPNLILLLIILYKFSFAGSVQYTTEHFVINYDTTSGSPDEVYGKDQDNSETIYLPDGSTEELIAGNDHPDYIERIGIYLEYSRRKALDIGYNYPDDVLDVTVKNLQENDSKYVYGEALYDPDLFGKKYIYIDNDMDDWEHLFENMGGSTLDNVLRGVVSIAIFHIAQGNDYLGGSNEFEDDDEWLVEGLANWFSNYIFDISNFFITTMVRNYSSISLNTPNSDYYRSAVGFLQFIEWKHSRAVLKIIWEKYVESRNSINALKQTYDELELDFKKDFADFGLQESYLKQYMDVPIDYENEEEKVDYWKTTLTPYTYYDAEVDVKTYYLDEEPKITITPPKLSRGEFPIRIKSDPQEFGTLDITIETPSGFHGYTGYVCVEPVKENNDTIFSYIDENTTNWSMTVENFGSEFRSVFINFVNADYYTNYPYGITIYTKYKKSTKYPEAPKNLNSQYDGKIVTIMWDSVPDPNITDYIIYRTPLSQLSPNIEDSIGTSVDTFFVDSSIIKGEDYSYYVRSRNKNGYKSPYSEKCVVQFCDLTFEIPKENPTIEDYFTIPILIKDVENLFSTSLDISYSANVVKLINSQEGVFLNENGLIPTTFLTNFDNDSGHIIIGLSRLNDNIEGAKTNQNKTLFTLKFKSLKSDTCFLKFSNLGFKTPTLGDIYVIPKDTFIVIDPVQRDTNQVADLYLKTPKENVLLFQDFFIPVMIGPVNDLYSISFDLIYDKDILNLEGIYESYFLNQNGLIPTSFNYNIDTKNGKIMIGLTRLDKGSISSENDEELLMLKFKAIKIGTSPLSFTNVKLLYPELINFKSNPINSTIDVQKDMSPCRLLGLPQKEEIPIGDTCVVNIKAGNFINLFSVAMDLVYDPSFLKFLNVKEGNLFNENGSVNTSMNFQIDHEDGRSIIGLSRLDNSIEGVSCASDTTIMTAFFVTKKSGNTNISFENFAFLAPDGLTNYDVNSQSSIITISPPQAPKPFSKIDPKDSSYVNFYKPTLKWEFPDDDDLNDTLFFDLHYSLDSKFENEIIIDSLKNNEIEISENLLENQIYYWNVLAYDKYGLKTWANDSCAWEFCINTKDDSPSTFSLLKPEKNSTIKTLNPTFFWQPAFDPDPYDTVRYEFVLSKDSNFVNTKVISGLLDDSLKLDFNLDDNTNYYWKVKAFDGNGGERWCTSNYNFMVNLINDPPQWLGLSDTSFYNDDSLIYNLNNNILDPDDSLKNLNITISFDFQGVSYTIKDTLLIIKAPNIVAKTMAIFKVTDPGNLSDVDTIFINILSPTQISDFNKNIPQKYALSQNYPNPFNPITNIEFSLPRSSHITVEIYNVLGQKLSTLIDTYKPAGYYKLIWDAGDLPTGIYICKLIAHNEKPIIFTKKMILLK